MGQSLVINIKYNYDEESSEFIERLTEEQITEAIKDSVEELESTLGGSVADCETFTVSLLKDGQVYATN